MAIRIQHRDIGVEAGLAVAAGRAQDKREAADRAFQAAQREAELQAIKERQMINLTGQVELAKYRANLELARQKFYEQSKLEEEIRDHEWQKEKYRLSQENDFQRHEQLRQKRIQEFEAGLDQIENSEFIGKDEKERLKLRLFLDKVAEFDLPRSYGVPSDKSSSGLSNLFNIEGGSPQTRGEVLPTGSSVAPNDPLGLNPLIEKNKGEGIIKPTKSKDELEYEKFLANANKLGVNPITYKQWLKTKMTPKQLPSNKRKKEVDETVEGALKLMRK